MSTPDRLTGEEREARGVHCSDCGHRLIWHHDERGCGYHGHGSDRCSCLLTSDDAARLAAQPPGTDRDALVRLAAEHRPNVVNEQVGNPDNPGVGDLVWRTRMKCDGEDCTFYAEGRRYWDVVRQHDEHLADELLAHLAAHPAPVCHCEPCPGRGTDGHGRPAPDALADRVQAEAARWEAALDDGCPSCGPVGHIGCDHIEGYHHALSDLRALLAGRSDASPEGGA